MFSRLYGAIINARNRLYEKGVFKSHSLGALTVSIGNITVGGTGKTPLVAAVAEILADAGEKVCILTRGYGRENPKQRILVSDGAKILSDVRKTGDEPFELAHKLRGKAVIVADANRTAAGVWALEKFKITAFVLDDAFQHRRVQRDLDIVCVDATNPFGNEKTLPFGILRETLSNINRADAIIITRANLSKDLDELQANIRNYNSACPIFVSENKVSRLIELKDFFAEKALDSPIEKGADKFLAFCALGNPENFFAQLRAENFQLAATKTFSDHHFYTQSDIEKLIEKARKRGATKLLTTAKDAVKLRDLKIDVSCLVAESRLVLKNENDFRQWILDKSSESKL